MGSNLLISSLSFQEQIEIITDKPHLNLMKHLVSCKDKYFPYNYVEKQKLLNKFCFCLVCWNSEFSRNQVLLQCLTFSYSKVLKCASF